MTTCSACPRHCSPETSRAYVLGPPQGVLCEACSESLAPHVARWLNGRALELKRAEAAAQAAVRTMRLLEAEALPRPRKGRRAA